MPKEVEAVIEKKKRNMEKIRKNSNFKSVRDFGKDVKNIVNPEKRNKKKNIVDILKTFEKED